VPTLLAIGHPDETTAAAAGDEARRSARDLHPEPEAIAVVSRNEAAGTRSTPTIVRCRAARPGESSGACSSVPLFFVPVLGMTAGLGLGARMGKVTKSMVDREFQSQVRDLLQPGTSVLFLLVDGGTPDETMARLQRYGGTVLTSSLSEDQERELHRAALHGERRPVSVPAPVS
jgi:uncharacterized membrane protein